MTDAEALAVAKVFDYLLEKRERSTVDFLLRTSHLPLKVPKTFATKIGSEGVNLATKIGSEGVNLDKQAFNAS